MTFLERFARKLGVLEYLGTWDASSGPPAIAQRGGYYVVSVAGSTNLNGITDWNPGDWLIWNGSVWEQIDNTDDKRLGDLLDVDPATPQTDDVLRYNGAKWAPGARSNVSAGAGVDYFFTHSNADVSGFHVLTKSPDTGTPQDEYADVVASSGHVLIDQYVSAAIGDSKIDAGIWDIEFFSYVSIPDGISKLHFHFEKRASNGTSTFLFHMDSGHVDAAEPTLYQVASVQPQFTVDPTDRLVIKVYGTTDNAATVRVHFLHSGNEYWTHVTTPLVQRHADLVGLQGGSVGQYFHLTQGEYTGDGTGVFVRKSALDAETSRAQAAEAGLSSDIAAEASTRATADLTFLKLDGSRAMTGPLAMGSNAISGATNITASGTATLPVAKVTTAVSVPTYTTATNVGTLTLTSASSSLQFITGVAAGFSVVLPDSRTVAPGTWFEIYNRSSSAITVKKNSGAGFFSLNSESVVKVTAQTVALQDGDWVTWSLEVQQASGVANVIRTQATSFTSAQSNVYEKIVDVASPLTYFEVTPPSGLYAVQYSASATASLQNALIKCALFKGVTQVTGTERTTQGVGNSFNFQMSTLGTVSLNGAETLSVQVKASAGTTTITDRTLLLIRLGGAI